MTLGKSIQNMLISYKRGSLISFADALKEAESITEVAMEELLPEGDGPEAKLSKAMRYAAFSGGKRLLFTITCCFCALCF